MIIRETKYLSHAQGRTHLEDTEQQGVTTLTFSLRRCHRANADLVERVSGAFCASNLRLWAAGGTQGANGLHHIGQAPKTPQAPQVRIIYRRVVGASGCRN